MDQFGLSEEQFAKIAPHLPTNTRGKPRVDDRLAAKFLAVVGIVALVSHWL